MRGILDTIGSQFLISLAQGPGLALDGYTLNDEEGGSQHSFLSLGKVVEDDKNILDQLNKMYCDANGRPYADVRIKRALVVHNPFDDPPEMNELMRIRGVELGDNDLRDVVTASPDYDRPPEERVEPRVPADQVELVDDENEEELARLQQQQEEEAIQHETKSRAVVLEMLGDLPSAEIRAPENVLFVCKLNSVTEDEDLELIFSRFDPSVKAEIIRDHDTGSSLQYAFVEFTKKQQAVEAYFKMNNALVDDRRIKVDFSQSVAKIWDKYNQKMKPTALPDMADKHRGRNDSGGGRGGGASP
jgi:peptidyl-prolyl cis-trans isomerase-like 4